MRLRKRVLCLKRDERRYRRKIAILKIGASPSPTQTRNNPTISTAVQIKPVSHLWDPQEFILTAEIQKWQVTVVHIQRGTIAMKDH